MNLLLAFSLVVLVMLFFVGLRTGVIAGLLVPMAMLGCMAMMPLFGVKLQIVSIGALIVSLGILVDNGVVVSENILVRRTRGAAPEEASEAAVRRLWSPLLVASLTTIFVFLPIPLAQTETGEYTFSLFLVITLTLLWSFALSMTFVPTLSYYLLKPGSAATISSGDNRFYRAYRSLLQKCLNRRVLFIFLLLGLIALSAWGFRFIPQMFFPPNEREILTVELWQPYGTDVEVTEERAMELADIIRQDDRIQSMGGFVGYSGPRWYLPLYIERATPNHAFWVIKCRSLQDLAPLRKRIESLVEERFPETRASVRRLERGPPVGAPIQIRLSGEEIGTLYQLRDQVAGKLRQTPGVTSVWDDWGRWSKKTVVDVDQHKAKQAGLSSEEIALSLQSQYSELPITEYRQEEEIIPIVARTQEETRKHLSRIRDAYVYSSATEQRVLLDQLASVHMDWQPSNIWRRNSMRTMTVKADLEPGVFAVDLMRERIRPELEKLRASNDWPEGYRVEYGGEFEESLEANLAILYQVPFAFGLILLLLTMLFNSARRVLILCLTLPPLFVGVTAGLLLTQAPFGFMALLGTVSLMGIVVNNGVVMMDQIERERQHRELRPALILAAQRRLRPVLMTATTTILGLLPLSLFGGELFRPLANALMFGLGFSTLVTLVWCPVLYSFFFRQRQDRKGISTGPEQGEGAARLPVSRR